MLFAHAARALRSRYGVGRHFHGHGYDHGGERERCGTGQLGAVHCAWGSAVLGRWVAADDRYIIVSLIST